MKEQLTLFCPPFSINKMSYRDKRYISQDAKNWFKLVFKELDKENNQLALSNLRNEFNPKLHTYDIKLEFFYPPHILYTKAGLISSKSHDLSNIEKPLIDLLFLPKYFEKKVPQGVKNLNIDDKYITSMSSSKRISNNHTIKITLEITNLSDLK